MYGFVVTIGLLLNHKRCCHPINIDQYYCDTEYLTVSARTVAYCEQALISKSYILMLWTSDIYAKPSSHIPTIPRFPSPTSVASDLILKALTRFST